MNELRENALEMQKVVNSLQSYINGVIWRCDHILEDMEVPYGTDEENKREALKNKEAVNATILKLKQL